MSGGGGQLSSVQTDLSLFSGQLKKHTLAHTRTLTHIQAIDASKDAHLYKNRLSPSRLISLLAHCDYGTKLILLTLDTTAAHTLQAPYH